MSEKTEELEGRVQEAANTAHTWKTFMEHPGWKLFEAFLKEQSSLRQQAVCLTPIASVGQAFSQEYYKGEFSGIGLALVTPLTQFELADQERRSYSKLLEVEDEHESEVALASASRVDGNDFGGEPEPKSDPE